MTDSITCKKSNMSKETKKYAKRDLYNFSILWHARANERIYICVCINLRIYTYTYIYVYVCMWREREKERKKERER